MNDDDDLSLVYEEESIDEILKARTPRGTIEQRQLIALDALHSSNLAVLQELRKITDLLKGMKE